MKVTATPIAQETKTIWTSTLTTEYEGEKVQWLVTSTITHDGRFKGLMGDVEIYTNTKGVAPRKWTWSTDDVISEQNPDDLIHEARIQLEEDARKQAEYMADREEQNALISPAFATDEDKQERIKKKTEETLISLRYIDDEG